MKRTTIICIAALALAAVCLPNMPEWLDKEVNQDIATYAYTVAQSDTDGQHSASTLTTTAKRHSLMRTLRKVCSVGNKGHRLGKDFINVWLVSIIR